MIGTGLASSGAYAVAEIVPVLGAPTIRARSQRPGSAACGQMRSYVLLPGSMNNAMRSNAGNCGREYKRPDGAPA